MSKLQKLAATALDKPAIHHIKGGNTLVAVPGIAILSLNMGGCPPPDDED